MTSLKEIKKIIEKNVLILATSKNNKPHLIVVADVKVTGNEIVITDNYMKETKNNLRNKNIALLLLNKNQGYELRGEAKYFSSGKWLEFVKKLKENKGFKPKGAIVVKIKKIKRLK